MNKIIFDLNIASPKPTEDDLLFTSYQHAEECGSVLPEFQGRILNFPGKMLFLNNEVADTHGGPRRIDDKRDWPCIAEEGDGTSGLFSKDCLKLQDTIASQVPGPFSKPGGRFNYLPPSDRAFVLGPHPDSERSIRFPLATRMGTSENYPHHYEISLQWLFDHSKRPVNTGKYFATFMASHCVSFRDIAAKRIGQLGVVHVGTKYDECMESAPEPPSGPPPRLEVNTEATSRHSWGSNWQMFVDYKVSQHNLK